jgi:glycosyltransferase involved in cell wall biosynthesis
MSPFISIFIPAYKNEFYLQKLLDSIVLQTWKDYEVVISDDSPNSDVANLVESYKDKISSIEYCHNRPAKGMPANWNYAKKICKGEWLKIMHDDDWFAQNDGLEKFAKAAQKSTAKFIFSAYQNIQLKTNTLGDSKQLSEQWKKRLKDEPMILMSSNVIGPPSVTMVHKSILEDYDERLRWRVDLDYYIRILQQTPFAYLDEVLVNIGISDIQITQEVKYQKQVELPEAMLILEKYGLDSFKNIIVFDSWWRLIRNLDIRIIDDTSAFVDSDKWPNIIKKIIAVQGKIPISILRKGIFSKLLMTLNYYKLIKIKKLEKNWK